MTIVFDGKKLAAQKEEALKERVKGLDYKPKLLAIRVGDDPASKIYLGLKQKAAERIGINFEIKVYEAEISPEVVTAEINQANSDLDTHGIMIQLPLPKQLSVDGVQQSILDSIDPAKDVDCLTSKNLGLVMKGQPRFLPATVKAIIEIIQNSNIKVQNSNVTIVGGSILIGKPLSMVLSDMGATVTVCRSKTENLQKHTSQADILISATGVPDLIKVEMIKADAIVIDVGSPKGDIDFEAVKDKVSFITPVPGGVGPLTVVSLFENLL